jgi:hypothetical protein
MRAHDKQPRRKPLREFMSASHLPRPIKSSLDRLRRGGSRAKGSRVGDDLVEAFEEMAKHLRGEIELEAHDLPGGA